MKNLLALRDKTTQIWGHQGFQKYFKNTGWLFAGRIFSLAISFFVGIYIARYLGPSNYGVMNYSISFAGLFAFLASLGIENIVKRELIKRPEDTNYILGTGLTIKIVGAFVAIAAIFISILFLNPEPLVFSLVLLFSISYIFYAFDILTIYFESQTQSKYPVIITIITTTIGSILKILIIFNGYGIVWLISTYVFEALIICLGLVLIFRYKGHDFKKLQFKLQIAKQILKDSWPLMMSGLAVGIYLRIDQVMINSALGSTGVGVYAAAVKIAESFYFIPTLIGASIAPAVINSLKVSEESFERRLMSLYSLMLFLSVSIAIVISISSTWLIEKLFGQSYSDSAYVLQIYVWAGVAVFMGVAVGYYLLAKNLSKISFYSTLFGMVSNVILNLILIPRLGISGAAIATLISYSVSTLGVLLFREPRNHMLRIIKKPLKIIKWGINKYLIKFKIVFSRYFFPGKKIKLNIGAALDQYDGWISTDITTLDITKLSDWSFYFKENSIDSILAEHVFEHLTMGQIKDSLINIKKYLKKGGVFRMAVPDGNHPSEYIIELVKPMGLEHGADDHKTLFTIGLVRELSNEMGLGLNPVEYFDNEGVFNKKEFNYENGYITRCSKNYVGRFTRDQSEFQKMIDSTPEDLRKQFTDQKISYTSLLVDFIKK